jgi:hypothetical protein
MCSFIIERLSVVEMRRAEGCVGVAACHSFGVSQRPHKAKEAAGCVRANRGRDS